MTQDHDISSILFDANCIVYHCFHTKVRIKISHSKHINVDLKYPIFTDQIHEIVNYLCKCCVSIKTIEIVWNEIQKKGLAIIVNEFINSKDFPFNSKYIGNYEKLNIEKKLQTKLQELSNKPWFKIEPFIANQDRVDKVIAFYRSLLVTEKMIQHLSKRNRKYPEPSFEDINLLIFSKENKLPLLSNDNDFVLFQEEIEENNICYRIFPLSEITDPSILTK